MYVSSATASELATDMVTVRRTGSRQKGQISSLFLFRRGVSLLYILLRMVFFSAMMLEILLTGAQDSLYPIMLPWRN
jgi:hypothetical protein